MTMAKRAVRARRVHAAGQYSYRRVALPALAGTPISIWAYQTLIQKLEAGKFDAFFMPTTWPC